MEKKKILLFGQIFLVIIWMFLIFNFSNQNAKNSQGTSDKLLYKIVEVVKGEPLSESDKKRIRKKYSFYVRKSAHFFLYFVLGITIYSFLNLILKSPYRVVIFSVLICFLYACSDEFHQSFVPGRAARYFDVMVDTCGAMVSISGILFLRSLISLWQWKFKKIDKKNKNNKKANNKKKNNTKK